MQPPINTKRFSTLAVVGALTGTVLEEKGFSGIHEVFDFFYPGIMTLGVCAMADNIKALLLANRPDLENFVDSVEQLGWQEVAKTALLQFGETIELTSSGKDANFDGLERELAYIREHRPDMQAAIVAL